MRRLLGWLTGVLGILALSGAFAAPADVRNLQLSDEGQQTTLRVAVSDDVQFRIFTLQSPDRVVLDILSARLSRQALPLPAATGSVRQLRAANRTDGSVRLVLDMALNADPQALLQRPAARSGSEIVVNLPMAASVQPPEPAPAAVSAPAPVLSAMIPSPVPATVEPPRPEEPSRPGERAPPVPAKVSSERPPSPPAVARSAPPSKPATAAPPARGRDIVIAVDAGHGGKDPGAHGPTGVREKDVTLEIARRLVEIINAEPGMRGVLTRSRDEFVELRARMERARAAQADLFLSVHADAVRNRSVSGSSVYVLNEKGATDEASRRLAARENAADLIGGVSLRRRDRTLASVLLDLSQNASLSSSIEVGDEILGEMARVGTVRKKQVMQAPFMVLKSPDVPSVLIETAYISNPEEERRLNTDKYRRQLARAIFAGTRNYFYANPPRDSLVAQLSGRRLAQNVEHVIRPGESLSEIAQRYNVSIGKIRATNGISGSKVMAGQRLRIPLSQEI